MKVPKSYKEFFESTEKVTIEVDFPKEVLTELLNIDEDYEIVINYALLKFISKLKNKYFDDVFPIYELEFFDELDLEDKIIGLTDHKGDVKYVLLPEDVYEIIKRS